LGLKHFEAEVLVNYSAHVHHSGLPTATGNAMADSAKYRQSPHTNQQTCTTTANIIISICLLAITAWNVCSFHYSQTQLGQTQGAQPDYCHSSHSNKHTAIINAICLIGEPETSVDW